MRFEGDRYSPDPQGEPAVIVAAGACDEWGWRCVDDLIAYRPREPERWALRRGDEAVLGRSALVDARMRGEPVMLFQHPHEWILNGSAGAVVIDWRGVLLPWFRAVKVLATESGIAARLQRHFDGKVANQRPKIRVCEARDAA